MRTVVVYVHGLWLTGLEGTILRRRLGQALSADTYAFSYPSVRSNLATNALAFRQFLGSVDADALHIVAHSLGGLLTLKTFEAATAASLPPGRLVLLGPPLQGSLTAQRVARLPFGGTILGRAAREELLDAKPRRWRGSREVGVIAGNLSVGLGRLMGKHSTASDGTVFVEETRLDGATDHLELRASHTGLPFSKEVAIQCGAFFRSGRFNR